MRGRIWVEPSSPSDVLLHQGQALAGSATNPIISLELSTRRRLSQVAAFTRPVTSMDPWTGHWVVSGLASPEEYSAIFREFVFKNDGPDVSANGHLNRTVWFEVEDELGAKVRAGVTFQPRTPGCLLHAFVGHSKAQHPLLLETAGAAVGVRLLRSDTGECFRCRDSVPGRSSWCRKTTRQCRSPSR